MEIIQLSDSGDRGDALTDGRACHGLIGWC